MPDLKIKIEEVLQGGNVLSNLNKEIRQTESELARLTLQGKQNSSEFKNLEATYKGLISTKQQLRNEFKEMTGASKNSGVSMLQFGSAVGNVITGINQGIEVVKKMVGALVDLLNVAKSGAGFNVLQKGFVELSGNVENSEESLKLFKKALADNLDDKKIMQFANSFRLLGESDEDITKFFDIAERRTELFGGDVEQAITQLQRFIETGGKKGGLGLKFDVDAIVKAMAQLGNTTEDNLKKMSQEDQQILRKKAVYQLYGNTIDEINKKKKDEADSIQALFTLYENLKTKIESVISTALKPFINAINEVIDYISEIKIEFGNLNKEFPELEKSIKFLGEVFKRMGADALNSIKVFIDANVRLIEAAAIATATVVRGVAAGLLVLAKGAKLIIELTNHLPGVDINSSGIDNIISKLEHLGDEIAETSKVDLSTRGSSFTEKTKFNVNDKSSSKKDKEDLTHLEELNKQLTDAQKILSEIEADGGVGNQFWINQKKVVDDLNKSIEKYNVDMRVIIPDDVLQKSLESLNKGKILPDDLNKQIDQMKLGSGITPDNEDKVEEKKATIDEIFNQALSVGSELVNILGIGADSFIGKLISGLQSAIGLANSIVGLIANIAGGGGVVSGIFDFIGGIFGFAQGGLFHGAGTGTSDSNLIRVSDGEFITNANATKKYLPLLRAINNGQSLTEGYNVGGLVNRTMNMQPNFDIQIVGNGLSRLDEMQIVVNGTEYMNRRGERNLN